MGGNLPPEAGEPFSEWVERVWQARREREPRNNDGPPATEDGGGDGRTVLVECAAADARQQAILQRAIKWMEEGQALVGLLKKLLDANEQLRAGAPALEQNLEQPRHETDSPQRKRRDIVEVVPDGDLDMASVTQLNLRGHLTAGKTKIVLDLQGVDYIDSAGLAEVVRAMKRAREAGGDLRLCGLRDNVLRIIEMTGLNKAIAVFPTRDEALASWS
jgi:anti-sigma B factor antagonist